jgi:hypothetical protein
MHGRKHLAVNESSMHLQTVQLSLLQLCALPCTPSSLQLHYHPSSQVQQPHYSCNPSSPKDLVIDILHQLLDFGLFKLVLDRFFQF